MRVKTFLSALAKVAFPLAALAPAAANAGMGQPSPWQIGFQQAASPIMENIHWFHDFLLVIITLITLFVLALLLIVIFKFNARANPVPSKTTHNTLLEVAWTVIPVIVLVSIAVPSFRLLFAQLNIPAADVTIKATGKQWFWTYDYPDNGFSFDSLMLQDKDRKPDQPRLLAVDNEVVVPVNKVVRVQVIRRRRHSRFRGAVLRRQDRRRAGPSERDLVPRDTRGRLLRSMLGIVRQGPRLYADHGAGRKRPRLCRMARSGQEEVRVPAEPG
jgi:hypothetical protein